MKTETKTHVIKHLRASTSIGVSLLSAAATSVSIFNAEPNPVNKNQLFMKSKDHGELGEMATADPKYS